MESEAANDHNNLDQQQNLLTSGRTTDLKPLEPDAKYLEAEKV